MDAGIFIDFETNGMPDWKQPSESEIQPHIVQLAAVMVDLGTQKTVQSLDLIIKPNGWEITPEMTAIHGITHEQAMDVGVDESCATGMLLEFTTDRFRIAHNYMFDARIMRIALMRYFGEEIANEWKEGVSYCTAQKSRMIVALAKSKVPTLQEAYTHFYGKPFEGAHSAMADALACRDVYFAVQKQSS